LANSGEWMIVPNVEHLRACRTPTGPNKAKNEIHHSNLKINDYLYHIYTCHIAALASRPCELDRCHSISSTNTKLWSSSRTTCQEQLVA
jgi:hypothetical protein